jgi:hypothetical protein
MWIDSLRYCNPEYLDRVAHLVAWGIDKLKEEEKCLKIKNEDL